MLQGCTNRHQYSLQQSTDRSQSNASPLLPDVNILVDLAREYGRSKRKSVPSKKISDALNGCLCTYGSARDDDVILLYLDVP